MVLSHRIMPVGGARQAVSVLNAFRHQWFSHAAHDVAFSSTAYGAQRLSASMVLSRLPDEHVCARYRVLNAFRHQWFSHHCHRQALVERPAGAQRLSASMVLSPCIDRSTHLPALYECSTPFGINGSLTTDRESTLEFHSAVLNAFRHQWFSHLTANDLSIRLACRCSTPFGINGSLTRRVSAE